MADAYDIFIVMVTYDYSNAVIRAPSSFQSAEAIKVVVIVLALSSFQSAEVIKVVVIVLALTESRSCC